ncbi:MULTISPECIES: XisI protein [Planktothricoides]|uniref:XisI protein n=2 Tax=Planktothricoides raciborskii TaxID=132608 RepID=A0AAU8JH68_9CYAN|nr:MULTISPECIES: XisI protein [Planktothricoides]KOR37697.1 FdxN element excision controlling factor protein [Planktothricoides sp. SR001]MBD2544131.1 XisI protein [Planktothricoides raciborskii FACHB-1370]MBD2582616.1 XisI protein [Planktothricoides raciborskii FACHB-1261]
MDRLDFYRDTIEKILKRHADLPYSYGQIDEYAIVDRDRNHFLLFDVGWQQEDGKRRRVHGCITHVQIIDGKIWIQRDGIEDGITEELLEAGIPKSDIVLGFQPPEVRPYTGYGIS